MELGSPHTEKLRAAVARYDPDAAVVEVCASLEAELLALEPEERIEFLGEHGITGSGLARLVRAGFRLLGLQTFFTIGDNEVRAWTLRSGGRAPQAAGRVHTDFERGFIRAETISFDEFRDVGSMKVAKEKGLVRSEGKEYVVRDGDILLFRTSA
jgi:ribosome-binding ATPase YchF (GTP1/OBG family)